MRPSRPGRHQRRRTRDFVAARVARYGRIDVAFNNAGIDTPRAAPLHEQSIEDWQNVLRTNTRGVFLSMKHELPHRMAAGRGVIINNSSVSAEVGFPTTSPYNASKHGIASLTKVAALEHADKNIRVNAVARLYRCRSDPWHQHRRQSGLSGEVIATVTDTARHAQG